MTKRSWKTAAEMPTTQQVIWQDPMAYDPIVHGPPYLPTKMGKKAALDTDMLLASGYSNTYDALPTVLVLLRALAVIHQTNHWTTSGPTYYADHLLFDRLYNDLLPEIDSVAERAVGLGQGEAIANPRAQMAGVHKVVSLVYPTGGPISIAEGIEFSHSANQHFLTCVRRLAETMKADNQLSRGTDDLLAGIDSKHEEHGYLLKQRLLGDWKTP